MSIQAALAFFHAVRQRPDLPAQIAAWGTTVTTSHLVELASQTGFVCSASELQAAFRHDWIMHWMYHTTNPGVEGSVGTEQ